ncbi:ferredoxin [Streptomyces sp. NPDC048251]|uniref:ferredoxin n=1 Tax=Streptomyces sp. NPDC048251 TaxID=3154501 RepID=UPI0034489185
MTYVVAEPCVDVLDRACVDECPVDCIYEGGRMAFIQPDECVDCGACVQVCPVEAIYYEEDLPQEWSAFTRYNAEFFAGVGAPGGAVTFAKGSVPDPPEVTALPSRAAER